MMNRLFRILTIIVALAVVSGCVGKKKPVPLLPAPPPRLTCNQAVFMDVREIPDADFAEILDQAETGDDFETCWKGLMVQALEADRDIPMRHLARAVHFFNRQDTKPAFYLAAFQYFSKIVKGQGAYTDPQQQLLVQYLHLAIRDARTKNDRTLKKAMLVCSRLDPDMYDKFFN